MKASSGNGSNGNGCDTRKSKIDTLNKKAELEALKEDFESNQGELEKRNDKLYNLLQNSRQMYHSSRDYSIDVNGNDYKFGIVGGTYFGRTSTKSEALKKYYDMGVANGIKDYYVMGNIIAGRPRKNKLHEYDIYAMDLDEQINIFKNEYPKIRGVKNKFMVGISERSFEKSDDVNVVELIEDARSDFECIGGSEKDVRVDFNGTYGENSVVMKLMHPKESELARNKVISRKPQNIVSSLTGGEKPDILILGRYDVADMIPNFRGVQTIQAGCFCDQTARMKEKSEPAHMGGWYVGLNIENNDNATNLNVSTKFKTFYNEGIEKDFSDNYGNILSKSKKDIMKMYDELNKFTDYSPIGDIDEQIRNYSKITKRQKTLMEKQDQEFKKMEEVLHYYANRAKTNYVDATRGNKIKYGVISDTHYGSQECCIEEIDAAVDELYKRGVRVILHPGDISDGYGMHAGQQFEQTHVGFDAQLSLILDALPKKPGLKYKAIRGNHDMSLEKQAGANILKWASEIRDDIEYIGDVVGFVDFNMEGGKTAKIMLMHPGGGSGMYLSQKPQRIVEMFAGSPMKPNTAIPGHTHKASCMPTYMNTNTIQAGCFQKLTKFMASKPTKGHVGAWYCEESYGDFTNEFGAQFIPFSNGDVDEEFLQNAVSSF